jgi:hypothetical protein
MQGESWAAAVAWRAGEAARCERMIAALTGTQGARGPSGSWRDDTTQPPHASGARTMSMGRSPSMSRRSARAPAFRSMQVVSTQPCQDAVCRAVLPCLSAQFTSAPAATRASTAAAVRQLYLAYMSGVRPLGMTPSTRAPAASSAAMAMTLPLIAPCCSCSMPTPSNAFGSAPASSAAAISGTSPRSQRCTARRSCRSPCRPAHTCHATPRRLVPAGHTTACAQGWSGGGGGGGAVPPTQPQAGRHTPPAARAQIGPQRARRDAWRAGPGAVDDNAGQLNVGRTRQSRARTGRRDPCAISRSRPAIDPPHTPSRAGSHLLRVGKRMGARPTRWRSWQPAWRCNPPAWCE